MSNKEQEPLPPVYYTVFYVLRLMGGATYQLDPEEVIVVQTGIGRGGFIQLKQALINTSSISSIEPDRDRMSDWKRKISEIRDKYAELGPDKPRIYPKPPTLKNYFGKESNALSVQKVNDPGKILGRT